MQRLLIVGVMLLGGCGAGTPNENAETERIVDDPTSATTGQASVPDFSGVWSNSSLTTLTRPENIDSLVLTPEEAETLAAGNFHNLRAEQDAQPSDPDRGAPEQLDRLPPVGNYSANWVDPGSRYATVAGEIRSSWIVDPPDGQLPLSESARARARDWWALRNAAADPEAFMLGERCLLGFGGSSGPPMLNVLYNNFYRIVQTRDHLVILAEMVHDARIVPLDTRDASAVVPRWLGNSTGHFEGDSLVITTSGFHPARMDYRPLPLSGDAVVTETLRKEEDGTLYYGFEIVDPAFYTQTVRGEMSFERRDDRVYEYACHEGNYAIGSMLRGARLEEAEPEGG